MLFFLGTHKPQWLADARFQGVPLFVSRRTLAPMRTLPRAVTDWALDSGGFTELALNGRWVTTEKQYIREVRRIQAEVGGLMWAAPQDWMCEGVMLEKTGKTVSEHQRLTVDNLLSLRAQAPDLPFVPVLQGWTLHEYMRCVELYDKAGVDLRRERIVGVGTVCRRQATDEAAEIIRRIAGLGIRVHGFGFKKLGLPKAGDVMTSADSLAWSLAARRAAPLPGHDKPGPGRPTGHRTCSNCPVYALQWRETLLEELKEAGVPLTPAPKLQQARPAPRPVKSPKVEPVKPARVEPVKPRAKEKPVAWSNDIKWFV